MKRVFRGKTIYASAIGLLFISMAMFHGCGEEPLLGARWFESDELATFHGPGGDYVLYERILLSSIPLEQISITIIQKGENGDVLAVARPGEDGRFAVQDLPDLRFSQTRSVLTAPGYPPVGGNNGHHLAHKSWVHSWYDLMYVGFPVPRDTSRYTLRAYNMHYLTTPIFHEIEGFPRDFTILELPRYGTGYYLEFNHPDTLLKAANLMAIHPDVSDVYVSTFEYRHISQLSLNRGYESGIRGPAPFKHVDAGIRVDSVSLVLDELVWRYPDLLPGWIETNGDIATIRIRFLNAPCAYVDETYALLNKEYALFEADIVLGKHVQSVLIDARDWLRETPGVVEAEYIMKEPELSFWDIQ